MASRTLSPEHSRPELRRRIGGAVCAALLLVSAAAEAEDAAPASMSAQVLTNVIQIWEIPREERAQPHAIRTEFTVYYSDPEWSVAFGECSGVPTFLPITGA